MAQAARLVLAHVGLFGLLVAGEFRVVTPLELLLGAEPEELEDGVAVASADLRHVVRVEPALGVEVDQRHEGGRELVLAFVVGVRGRGAGRGIEFATELFGERVVDGVHEMLEHPEHRHQMIRDER